MESERRYTGYRETWDMENARFTEDTEGIEGNV